MKSANQGFLVHNKESSLYGELLYGKLTVYQIIIIHNIYTIGPRDSLDAGADKIIWLYRGLAITEFTRKPIYSMKLVVLDWRKRL